MIGRFGSNRAKLWLVLAVAIAFVAVIYSRRQTASPARGDDPFPIPPPSPTPFQNTGPDAQFVGVDACKECHQANHLSYLHTAHSRALSDLDATAEPADAAFEHKRSGRSFRVYRKDGQLRQEEVARTPEGKEIARMDLPVRYLIGSGHFCRSYLVEVDGFLYESPITWYTSKKRWDVSPGYDFPQHFGFERPIEKRCAECHAGRVAENGESIHRLTISEKSIGCESCHGPGGVHTAKHRRGKTEPGENDPTIVNPGKLSRTLLEAICANCHQSGVATAIVRGRNQADFRPGMPLTDYRVDYRYDVGNEKMTVVGHMDQLRRSQCYQKSPDLTCLTCHDPHAKEPPKDPIAFYRQKCLNCHADKSCSLEPAVRLKKDPTDNCSACHMPRGDTDIPHIAFTHHRIGKHPEPPTAPSGRVPALVPIDDDSQLPPMDRKRNLGLAYLRVSVAVEPERTAIYRAKAKALLDEVYAANLRDGLVLEGLARIYQQEQFYSRAVAFAKQAIDAQDLAPPELALALTTLADGYVQTQKSELAIEPLMKLTQMRRQADDWYFMGLCYINLDRPADASKALEQAILIQPFRPHYHEALAEAYKRSGNDGLAKLHREKAQLLIQYLPQ